MTRHFSLTKIMINIMYMSLIMFIPRAHAEPTNLGLIQLGDVAREFTASLSSSSLNILNNYEETLTLLISFFALIFSIKIFTQTYTNNSYLERGDILSYRSLIDIVISDSARAEVASPLNVAIGFTIETMIYLILYYLCPPLFIIHPLIVFLFTRGDRIKFLLPTPSFIILCQFYYLTCSPSSYGYRGKLAFIGEKIRSILLVLDDIWYWALKTQAVADWFSATSKYGLNHTVYLTSLYGLIYDMKMTPSKVACIAANMASHFSLHMDGGLLKIIQSPFAQANYENDLFDSAFSFLGIKFSNLKKMGELDVLGTKALTRFQAIKQAVRRFIIQNYLHRSPSEYDLQYLYPEWHANFENLSRLSSLTDTQIAGYAVAYNRTRTEMNSYWSILKDLSTTEAPKEMAPQYAVYKELAREMNQRMKGISPAFTEIRQEPVCVVLTGLSDTGKTTNFCKAISKALLREKDFSYYNNVYFPCKSSQYWTGYSPETSHVVVIDDAAPLKMPEIPTDLASNPYAIFMDLCNTCNVTLDQAAISDKGMKFKSELILVSNNAEVDTKSFATPAALLNRLFQVEVLPKPEFMNMEDVKFVPLGGDNKFYIDGVPTTPTTREYYFNNTNHLQDKQQNRMLNVNKAKYIKHVQQAEALDVDEFERSVAIMDYCVFRVKKGKFPAYFTSGGRKLKEGDFLDARTLLTLLDQEYKRLKDSFDLESSKCAATQDKIDMQEFIDSLRRPDKLEPISLQSTMSDFISYAGKELNQFQERYQIETYQLIKIAAFIAAVFMFFVAIYRFLNRAKENDSKDESVEELFSAFDVPVAQANTADYEKWKKAKAAAYKVKKFNQSKTTAKWKMPKGQGATSSSSIKAVHTNFEKEIAIATDLIDCDYEQFFEYPPMEEEPDVMLQYASAQHNQDFRQKYMTKGAILVFQPKREKPMFKAIAIREHMMMIPHHMTPYLKYGFEIQTMTSSRLLIKPEEWSVLGHKDDKCIIQLKRLPFSFPNFLNNFVSEKDLPDVINCQPQLLMPGFIKEHLVMMVASMASAQYKVETFQYIKPGTAEHDQENEDYWISLPRYLYYSCTNAAGYCGSPVVGTTGPFAGKIIGMHIAGDYKMSYATITSKEDILSMIPQAQGLSDYKSEPAIPLPQCRESSLKKSRFFDGVADEFGVEKFPPICKKYKDEAGEVVEPCQSKLDAFHDLEAGLIDKDVDRIVRSELTLEAKEPGPPLTDDETIFGYKRLNGMDMSTAIGYFLTVNDTRTKIAGEGKRKQYFPHRSYDGRIITPSGWNMVQAEIKKRLELLKIGVLKTEYIASPKTNEALKPGKGVRLFYVGDVITLFMVRQYFGDLLSDVMANNVDNEMAIGINPYSFDWKRIIIRLTSMEGANYNDGDVSGMEYNMYFPEVKDSIIKATMAFYRRCDAEDNIIRENLVKSLFNCRVIWDNWFHDGMTFNPSGHPLTTYFNCMVIRYWKRYTFYTIQLETHGSLIEFQYAKYNRLIVMGDDSVEAIHRDIKDWYLPGEAAKVAGRFGIVMTTATKDTDFKPKTSLQECDFLKRKFDVSDVGTPIPKLDKISIQTSLMYVKGRHSTEARNSCVDAALCEAYYHGEDYFFQIRDCIVQIKKRKRLNDLIVHHYDYYAQRQAEAYCGTAPDMSLYATYSDFF